MFNRNQWRSFVRTLYKRKDKKVRPANVPLPDGINPGGSPSAESSIKDSGQTPDQSSQSLPSLQSPQPPQPVAPNVPPIMPTGGKIVPRGSRLTPERLAKMKIGVGFLSGPEKQLFIDILFEHEGAIAFDESEMGLLDPSIEPPVVIHTIPHTPWQQQNLRLPKAMQDAATAHVKEKLDHGILELSQGPYRSRYFLVGKKVDGEWRFINDVQPLNRVTIRDSGMPPAVDEFSEDFAGYPIISAIDYFSGYYQISLDKRSRDLTAFLTDLGLVRMTRLPQGWTNSVATFQRVIGKVHYRQIPDEARAFVDDVVLKNRTKARYDNEEIAPGIRRFVYEHAQVFRQFMHDAWVAGLTISGYKSAIGMCGVEVLGFICDERGRRPEPKKVQRILDWPIPQSTRDARSFIGVVVYYRIFILDFAIIAAPIFILFRKGKRFEWTPECQIAMDSLKLAITEAPVLISLDLSPSGLSIFLYVDASSTIGWGGILSQLLEDGLVHPARYESGIWSDAERKYDALKLECRGLLKALKKFRFWLFGRYFTVRTDSQSLVWLLNQPPNDLPNAMMTRWLSYIRLFDFDVSHVPGNKNGAADGLSRRGKTPEDESDSDPDDYFESKLYSISADFLPSATTTTRVYLNEGEYAGDDLILGRYLETLERPAGLTDAQYQQLRKKSRDFFVRDGLLFKRGRKRGLPPRRVVNLESQRTEIIRELHDEIGHRGKQATFEHVSRRYQWKGLYDDVAKYIRSCEECQRRARNRFEEPLHPTWTATVWEKVGVDVVYMPPTSNGYGFIVFARDDLSGWVEGRAIKSANSESVAKFLYEDVICRHGCPQRIVLDGGKENLDLTKDLLEHYRIKRLDISAYHPQSNGLVERGHSSVVNSLAKYSKKPGDWVEHLPLALWADRVSVRRTTGYSAFELVYGRECLLPVEFSVASWSVVDWEQVKDREDLLLARMQQLDQQNLELSQAAENLRNSRKANKAYFDLHKHLRPESGDQQLRVGDLVLRYKSQLQNSRARSAKLDDRWTGPYRIIEVAPDSTYYRLEEIDEIPLADSIAGNRLKRYFTRDELQYDSQLLKEFRDKRETAVRERQARSARPARLEELRGMIDAAKMANVVSEDENSEEELNDEE